MVFKTKLKQGFSDNFLMGRVAPALFACALITAPISAAVADPAGADIAWTHTDKDQADKHQEISETSLSPLAQQFLMTAQLAQAEDDQNDPFEGFNRSMFSFNEGFYDIVMRPVSDVYNVLPPEIRQMVGSFLSNLSGPVIFINDVLQGELERALTTAGRFVINSTFGLAGIVDVASSFGFEEHDEDFGQTLAVWGVDEGFYLVLPILGPGNPRDSIGRFVVDPLLLDPINYRLDETGNDEWIWGRFGMTAVDQFASIKEELDQIKKTSVDYYAAIRSLYRQKRKAEISNGDEMDLPPIPNFDFGSIPGHIQSKTTLGDMDTPVSSQDDQASLRQFEREIDDRIFENPFEASFIPALGAREIADRRDVYRPAPRKPAEFDWISVSTSTDDTMLAEMSWEAVSYRIPR